MYPNAYIAYLVHFHGDRDYFECHERLEEYWKSMPKTERSPLWVGLIQIAVAQYHHRRSNLAGAGKLMASAIRLLAQSKPQLGELGLDADALLARLKERLRAIGNGEPYRSFDLPIVDPGLRARCEAGCQAIGRRLGEASDITDTFLLHKHTLRDRSAVIREREERLRAKRGKRPQKP